MRRLRLVAWHEFVKYVTRRGFVISVLLMPVYILLGTTLPGLLHKYETPAHFVVVDHEGGYAPALQAALVKKTADERQDALAAWQKGPRAQPFVPPKPMLIEEPLPAGLAVLTGKAFAARVGAVLNHGTDAVIVIPKGFGAAKSEAEFWQSGPPKPDLRGFADETLTRAIRSRALAALAPNLAPSILDAHVTLRPIDPAHLGATAEQALTRKIERITPFAFAFLLMMTIFTNAATLMSAVIEEKSNRIVEVMLSCVTPREFMTGKLIAAAGASLLTLALWGGAAALAAGEYLPGGRDVLRAVLASLTHGITMPMLVLCFVCGLLIYASIFLAIGSMSASVQDSQALVGPTMLLVTAPFFILPALITDPNGPVASALTWVPVYTPFLMMFRLPWHPPALEVAGAMSLMVATTIILVWQMGRVFAGHVLTADKPPRLTAALASLFRRG